MFGLTQYSGNGALMATTGFMLTPLASALNRVGYSVSRDEDMPSIVPAQPSSEWSEWLTSGYVGDFLGWAGQQLAEVGSNIFPPPSKIERVQTMRANKREIKQFLSEKMWDETVGADISGTLNSYLRNGLVLMQMDSLDPEEWQEELKNLQSFSKMAGDENTVEILKQWIEQLDLLLIKKIFEEQEKAADLNSSENLPKARADYQPEEQLSLYSSRNSDSTTVDLGALGSAGFTINGMSAYDASGNSVSGAGDVNGDGFADVIIGASDAVGDAQQSGVSYVVFGSNSTSLAGSVIDLATLNSTKAGFTIKGVSAYGQSGYSVSGAGDVNGDGFADVIIGAPEADGNAEESGVCYVIFGNSSVSLAGSAIDLGTLSSTKVGFIINGANFRDASGYSVSGAGDVNGDGFADVIIGARYADGSAKNSGVSYVVFGSNSTALAGSVIDLGTLSSSKAGVTINGVNNNDNSGYSVSGGGDVNGDGFADVIIGARYADGDAEKSGVSYVVFGSNSARLAGSIIDLATLSGTKAGFTMNGAQAYDYSGCSVSDAGDVNGDGFADVIIGAFYATGDVTKSGVGYVVFGSNSTDLAGSLIDLATLSSTKAGFTINGAVANDNLGQSVSGAGDINGDGFADVIIGALYATGDAIHSGVSYVVFGSNSTNLAGSSIDLAILDSTKAGFKINGAHANDYSGLSVSGAGDVNKDGFADVIIGAPSAYGDAKSSGVSYVVFGSTSTPIPTPTPNSISKEKQTHLERNFIISGVIASGLLATGLFCFFYKKKYGNDLDHVEQELVPLNQDQSTDPETHTDTEKLQM